MPFRHVLLLRILLALLALFFALAAWRREWTAVNVVALVVLSLLWVFIGHVAFIARDDRGVDGLRGLPRSFWVLFASFTAAFGAAMLIATLGLPWLGYAGFTLLLGEWAWWALPLLAAGMYPLVKAHLR
ncbi:MAG TPA: hypothetical protein VMJ74_02040 [Pseudomonadales bacterium]|nr:hypothetical protein [Pseudomonadales bacterium]